MRYNKLCDIEDFDDPDLVATIQSVCAEKFRHFGPDFPKGAETRDDWELGMGVRALRDFEALHPDSSLLVVGAGAESILFHLSRGTGQVFAIDRYLDPGGWQGVAPLPMLSAPEVVGDAPFDSHRLVVQHMDPRWLRYPDEMFDGILGVRTMESLESLHDVANVAYEFGRVLKVGGLLALSVTCRLAGPPGGVGWPGRLLLPSSDDLQRYVVAASGLEPVDELRFEVSKATLSRRRSLDDAAADPPARSHAGVGEGGPEGWLQDFSEIVLVQGGYVVSSAHLTLRKTEAYPEPANDWARPAGAVIEAANRTRYVALAAGGGPAPAAPAPPAAASPPAKGHDPTSREGWRARLAAVQARVESLEGHRLAIEARLERLVEHEREVRRALAESTETSREIVTGLAAVGEVRARLDARVTEVPEADPADGSTEPAGDGPTPERPADPVPCRVTVGQGVGFTVVVDRESVDPVTSTFLTGHSLFHDLVSLMLQLVGPGDLVLDLGAHVGTFALAAAAAGCRVLAVEAAPANVRLLRSSVAHNGFRELQVVQAVATDRPGVVGFVPHGPWGVVDTGHGGPLSVSLPAVTIDELVFECGWRAPSFVKIDVEGSEMAALRGMSHLLSQHPGPALLYESNGHTLGLSGTSPNELLAQVEGFGYTSYLVGRGRLIRVRSDEMQPQTEVDYLAFKDVPTALAGWEISDAMTVQDRVTRLVADCRSRSRDRRAYIARALAGADVDVLSHPAVAAALSELTQDPADEVRAAVSWWTP